MEQGEHFLRLCIAQSLPFREAPGQGLLLIGTISSPQRILLIP